MTISLAIALGIILLLSLLGFVFVMVTAKPVSRPKADPNQLSLGVRTPMRERPALADSAMAASGKTNF